MAVQKKKKKAKIKFRKILFKVSDKQKKMLERYCKAHKLSMNKLMRRSLSEYIRNHYDLAQKETVSKNQMSIFDLEGVEETDEQDK